jgi:hypothetical protein
MAVGSAGLQTGVPGERFVLDGWRPAVAWASRPHLHLPTTALILEGAQGNPERSEGAPLGKPFQQDLRPVGRGTIPQQDLPPAQAHLALDKSPISNPVHLV